MSWIKDNKFLVALGSATLVGFILLYVLGSKGRDRYVESKEAFDSAASEVAQIERLPLYPRTENVQGKRKALDEYREAATAMQAAFQPFRPGKIENISPQDFTNHLKAVNDEVRAAFAESETEVPEPFFCGFESYKTTLARGNATGILDYQLAGIKKVMLDLAKSGVTELKNVHRPTLPEENGQPFNPPPTAVTRGLPLEITFSGPEESVRKFISTLVNAQDQYAVIRSIRVTNEKKDPPRASDAKFDRPKPAAPPAGADGFFGAFTLPGDEGEDARGRRQACGGRATGTCRGFQPDSGPGSWK